VKFQKFIEYIKYILNFETLEENDISNETEKIILNSQQFIHEKIFEKYSK